MSAPLPAVPPRDRSQWGRGPWDREGDSREWVTKAGYRAAWIRDGVMGHLCGYVELPEQHPMSGTVIRYAAGTRPDEHVPIDVHGGVTFSGRLAQQTTWWFGFDCCHGFDGTPLGRNRIGDYGTYRTAAYVEEQCEALAEQLASIAKAEAAQ